MGYRGEDLDLRTPQTWSASSAELAEASETGTFKNGQRAQGRSGPIWVDDTVLACANHAFDVALAHRSAEVRLEHFLHGLTRIDAATEALEARGVRVTALRRESATMIASEIPVGLPAGSATPRRSEALAEVLRLAAAAAARRNGPATIEDVLNVLFDQRSDVPGIGLLARHTIRTAARDSLEQFPPLSRYAEPPRYIQAPVDRYARVQAAEPFRPEALRYVAEAPRAYRSEFSGTPTDTIQNTRIEALEQMVRALSNDLSNERLIVSGMLKELSSDTQAHRDDQGRLHSGLYERMQTLEQLMTEPRTGASADGLAEQLLNLEMVLEQRLAELNQGWSSFANRLQGIESSVLQSGSGLDPAAFHQLADRIAKSIDLAPIFDRLTKIEDSLASRTTGAASDVSDRLKAIEGEVARAFAADTGRMEPLISGFERLKPEISDPILERLAALANAYRDQAGAANDATVKAAERLAAVERAVAAEIETAAAKHQAYAQDLGEVHDAMMKLNQNQHTLAGSIDKWRTDAAGDVAMIANRLANLDRDNERPMETLNALTTHMDTMNRMMIERYHRRNRFWYWLFGTDDWIGTSWPSQAQAIEAERQRLKISPKAS